MHAVMLRGMLTKTSLVQQNNIQYIVHYIYSNCTAQSIQRYTVCTQSLEGVCHGLVFCHVDESSSQAEMREDKKHLL